RTCVIYNFVIYNGGLYDIVRQLELKGACLMTMRPVKDDQAIEPAWDDAPTGVGGASYGGSLPNVSPNNPQDTHATSADMCEQIMAGIDRQLRLAI
ncbi:MAG: hypothetical protein K8953_02615, partial [Proteobacteria bacterium]|nr:hypothetical protein [Pseudomonadota bacterium]